MIHYSSPPSPSRYECPPLMSPYHTPILSSSSPSSSSSRSSKFTARANSPSNSASQTTANASQITKKRNCACSPTAHPGSFRCARHKGGISHSSINSRQTAASSSSYRNSPSRSLDYRKTAMKNSLVGFGKMVTALIRPSSHHQCRRAAFDPRPSRLSKMSKAADIQY